MLRCPRCQADLQSAEQDHFCPNHHGALLTLQEFQSETSRGFTKWFFASWMRFANKRTINCSYCGTKMVQLTVEGKTKFDLDVCPSCYALWLDSGEEALLQNLFQKQLASEKVRDLTSEQHQVLGKLLLQHDSTIHRYKFFTRLGRLFNRSARVYPNPWNKRHGFFLSSLFYDDDKEA